MAPSEPPVSSNDILGKPDVAGWVFKMEVKNVLKLKATAPFPVKFELYKKGNYRIVARLKLRKEWRPWVYTNPIYVY